MKYSIIPIIFFWSMAFGGHAQSAAVSQRVALQVGEDFPTLPAFPLINTAIDSIQLATYADRVLILDFFDTYCSSCIASLPRLQALQDAIGDKGQILMVTWQDRGTIERFLATNKFIQDKNIRLPFIYGDQLLKQFFPHKGIPHVAWLSDQKVQAITHSDFVDEANIRQLAQNGNIRLPLKDDFGRSDNSAGLQNGDNLPVKASMLLTGYRDGIPSSGFHTALDSASGLSKSAIYNQSIYGAYLSTWGKIRRPEFILLRERVIWQVADSSRYDNFDKELRSNVWTSRHAISYERYDERQLPDSASAVQALHDLNGFFGLEVYWDRKDRPCLLIRELPGRRARAIRRQLLIDHPAKQGSLGGTDALAFGLDLSGKYPPAVDEADHRGQLALESYTTLEELNDQLNRFGLEIIRTTREMDVLVFREVYFGQIVYS